MKPVVWIIRSSSNVNSGVVRIGLVGWLDHYLFPSCLMLTDWQASLVSAHILWMKGNLQFFFPSYKFFVQSNNDFEYLHGPPFKWLATVHINFFFLPSDMFRDFLFLLFVILVIQPSRTRFHAIVQGSKTFRL